MIDEVAGRSHSVKKQCLFCGLHFTGGPSQIRCHLDGSLKPRSIRLCMPAAAWKERHGQVVAELRKRRSEQKATMELETEKEAARQDRRVAAASKHFGAVAPSQVAEAWLKVVIKKALPLNIFDDPDFREAVCVTARSIKVVL